MSLAYECVSELTRWYASIYGLMLISEACLAGFEDAGNGTWVWEWDLVQLNWANGALLTAIALG